MSVKSLKTGTRSFSLLAGNTPEHHVLIAETTVGSGGAASVTFSNIPSTYQHLQIRGIGKQTDAGSSEQYILAQINNDSTHTNYRLHALYGTGATASSTNAQNSTLPGAASGLLTQLGSTSIFAGFITDILDYANTSKYKTIRSLCGQDSNGSGGIYLLSSMWISTNAITSLTFIPPTLSFAQHSTFQLFGVK